MALSICTLYASAGAVAEEALSVPYVEESRVIFDGSIGQGEYGGSFSDPSTNMTVHWEHDGVYLLIGLVSPGTGWASIGLGVRGTGMDGANLIIGYMTESGGLVLLDEIGIGRNHFPDTERGGEDDILSGAGSEEVSKTVLEFSLPLDSGDGLDQSFAPNGTYGFFLGYHESAKDTSSYHTARSETRDLFIEPVPGLPPGGGGQGSWIYYVTGGLAVVAALVLLVRYMKRPRVIRFRKEESAA